GPNSCLAQNLPAMCKSGMVRPHACYIGYDHMALSPRLEFRQSQSLTLTPQLMQSIRLLQLSHLELNAFIDTELLRNPLLEREDAAEPVEAENSELAERPRELDSYEDTAQFTETIQSAESIADGYGPAVEHAFPDRGAQDGPGLQGQWSERGGSADFGEAPDIDQFVAARPSLSEHLTAQIGLLLQDPAERLIARFLTDSLDEAGYLVADLDAVATRLGTTTGEVERVLLAIQGCEPLGVFARDLAECLAIQLRERDRFDPLMQKLLANLDLLAAHDMPALARATGADREDLADMLAELRRLDPRPGRAFAGAPVETVVPDVFLRAGPDGGWAVELNADILPRVLVNRSYYATVVARSRGPAEKTFLTDCLATANWLTRSLDQRAQTILKVTSEIVTQQDAFLLHG